MQEPAFTTIEATLQSLPLPVGDRKTFHQSAPPIEQKKEIALPAVANSNPQSKRETCKMCGMSVQSMLPDNRRVHVSSKHAKFTLKCQVDGCSYEVTDFHISVFLALHKHSEVRI